MKNQIIIFTGILILLVLFIKCNEKDEIISKNKEAEGYIIGFDPCTINQHYRIGYVIVTKDYKDTLITYNISDLNFKVPASVVLNSSDTLYIIPEYCFQDFYSTFTFPQENQSSYKIKFTYTEASEVEKIYNLCQTNVLFLDFKQIIIKSISK